eukprot:995254-Amphidinium_carterae.1
MMLDRQMCPPGCVCQENVRSVHLKTCASVHYDSAGLWKLKLPTSCFRSWLGGVGAGTQSWRLHGDRIPVFAPSRAQATEFGACYPPLFACSRHCSACPHGASPGQSLTNPAFGLCKFVGQIEGLSRLSLPPLKGGKVVQHVT